MAVNSYGIAPNCNGNDYQFRTDIPTAQDFLLEYIGFEAGVIAGDPFETERRRSGAAFFAYQSRSRA